MIKFDWFTTPVTTLTSHGRVTHSTEERPRVLASHTLFRARAILHFYSVQLMLVCTHIDTKSVARKTPPLFFQRTFVPEECQFFFVIGR